MLHHPLHQGPGGEGWREETFLNEHFKKKEEKRERNEAMKIDEGRDVEGEKREEREEVSVLSSKKDITINKSKIPLNIRLPLLILT